MEEKVVNKKNKGWVIFLLCLFAVVLLIYFTQGSNNGKELDFATIKTMIGSKDEDTSVYESKSKISVIRLRTDGIGFVLLDETEFAINSIESGSD